MDRQTETATTPRDTRRLPPHAARAAEDADGPTFSITQLAEEFGITTRAIRFYEDKDLLHPARAGQTRIYSVRDRVRLQLILQGKRVGFTLAEIREILDIYDLRGHAEQLELTRKKFRTQIEKLKEQREDIDRSLVQLEQGLEFVETELGKKTKCASSKQAPNA